MLDTQALTVSMKSGLEDRNNETPAPVDDAPTEVSMKSGLEDRNNRSRPCRSTPGDNWSQ